MVPRKEHELFFFRTLTFEKEKYEVKRKKCKKRNGKTETGFFWVTSYVLKIKRMYATTKIRISHAHPFSLYLFPFPLRSAVLLYIRKTAE